MAVAPEGCRPLWYVLRRAQSLAGFPCRAEVPPGRRPQPEPRRRARARTPQADQDPTRPAPRGQSWSGGLCSGYSANPAVSIFRKVLGRRDRAALSTQCRLMLSNSPRRAAEFSTRITVSRCGCGRRSDPAVTLRQPRSDPAATPRRPHSDSAAGARDRPPPGRGRAPEDRAVPRASDAQPSVATTEESALHVLGHTAGLSRRGPSADPLQGDCAMSFTGEAR